MDWLILGLCGFVLFAARDARGLARFANARLYTPYAAAYGLEVYPAICGKTTRRDCAPATDTRALGCATG